MNDGIFVLWMSAILMVGLKAGIMFSSWGNGHCDHATGQGSNPLHQREDSE